MIETRTGVERERRVEQDHLGPATGIRDYDGLTTISDSAATLPD